ncbi:amino acid transporter [Advenella kashmirensis W13003]|uniref:Amino acid transporter n=1 Tax=Advenella kashmirensis W13003 TaxID=1424334 RepID=V8QTS7_9BURK|nr:LysE/ArgO family amino acid transporter [Advenella kashmirensis]ETF02753.1 amino acid transporter [Advenella kashmirensis W13003]
MNAYLSGLFLSGSLILAIGSQNAFVLKQGLRKSHVFWICLVCSLSDAALILTGVLGFSVVVRHAAHVVPFIKYAGALFLFVYGLLHFHAALTKTEAMQDSRIEAPSLKRTLLVCLALTWLNPHVYLDTLLLIGSVSTRFPGQQWLFAAGGITASLVFFFSLGYGARLLLPLFKKPIAWKILDLIVGVTMWVIAWQLVWGRSLG